MKIYVGTYGKYNSGSIKGQWVELTNFSDKEEFIQYCQQLHSDENDAESMFQDYDVPKLFDSLVDESFVDGRLWGIIEYLEDNSLDVEDVNDMIYLWNDCCQEGYIMDWDMVEEDLDNMSGFDAFRLGKFSSVNWSDDYFRYNGYGNLESTCSPLKWVDEYVILEHLLSLV